MTTALHSKDTTTALVAFSAALVTATAATTYLLTTRYEQSKERARAWKQYQREKLLKEKTAEARKTMKEPSSGTLIDDVFIDKVFLWECQDLRKSFASANVANHMHFQYETIHPLASTALQRKNSTEIITQYNKLITDHECILGDIVRKPNKQTNTVAYMRAGPRRYLHFDPAQVNAAIVTCGGLCPGLNNVIREITKSLYQLYAIGGKVYGIRGGYRGFWDPELEPVELTLDLVENIHHGGGTVLGSSRGGFDLDKILDFVRDRKISQLFVIGGDGTHRGAFRIHEGCIERGYNVAVAGIPKTIDNDVDYIDQSFGFQSAVEAAQVAIRSAKTEAVCNLPNGIGIVKLMGRSAGFIAAHSTMASSDVDLCLVPEVPVVLDGETGCLPHLMRRVKQQGYAVVVVAEGAGEEVLGTSTEVDASGNKKLPAIGEFMKKSIEEYFKKHGETATVKYIDPSYTVRTVPANAADSLYCMQLAQNAVHGAMAGYTGFSVGLCNNRMVLLPIPELVATSPRSMNARGRTWERVIGLTRQPNTVPELEEGKVDPKDNQPTPH
ncbi:6-phosphofructokinase 1 [Fistulifera solaris]|uniref:6-phosphofructokinase 1 n=1 Tax=Fistulifera solaris TaxID=1519565 RepID=A0A1Z5JWH5_FISSO|nr:6-phosphofructokinase 1 [Fistulifera solaris]|eukprot:GAX18192.1 6-phosphofructokinase 1 [Fistulifera solaris]